MKVLATTILALVMPTAAATPEHPMFKQAVEAAVGAVYYQNNCNPGTLSLRTIQFMAGLIKHASEETRRTAVLHTMEAEQRYGGVAQYCAALNNPRWLKSLENLQDAIEDLPRE